MNKTELVAAVAEKAGLSKKDAEKAKEYIVDNGYDPVYGARPLRRFIQHSVETLLAKFILQGECKEGDTLTIDVKDGNLYIKTAE